MIYKIIDDCQNRHFNARKTNLKEKHRQPK